MLVLLILLYQLQFLCKYCDKTFGTQSYLNKHIKNIHEGKKHICDICKLEYSSRRGLNYHKKKT